MAFAQYDINKIKTVDPGRTKYFEGIGVDVKNADSLEAALVMSGLDFEVEKVPMGYYTKSIVDGTEIMTPHIYPDQFVTVRKDTQEPLGPVGKNYNIFQNRESFDFLDSIIGTGQAQFETAGLYDGAKSFITIKTEGLKILGEDYEPYILLINSFDGSGAVRAMFTSIRCFCSNCLERAMKNATNKISVRHSNSLQGRIETAREMLQGNTNYLTEYKKEAEKLATLPYTKEQFGQLISTLYPIDREKDTPLSQGRTEILRNQLMNAYNADDLQNFNGTAYKALQAVADAESHKIQFRNTKNSAFAGLKTVIDGMPLTNQVAEMLLE